MEADAEEIIYTTSQLARRARRDRDCLAILTVRRSTTWRGVIAWLRVVAEEHDEEGAHSQKERGCK